MGDTLLITKEMKTGEVIRKYPATRSVFTKYFGAGCFDCPSFGVEDINLACLMHNTDVEKFVKELNEVAVKELDSSDA